MLSDLSQGIKISITRSITTAFEHYMARILWDENAYKFEDFMQEWQKYISTSSSWYDKVNDEIKSSPEFHEELAVKINEVVKKILSEVPTPEQIDTLDQLQKELGTDYDYSYKAEAKFYIDFLTAQLKKKEQLSPADEKELTIAALLYYHVYDQELPNRSYSKQDIEYIIQKLQQTLETGKDELVSSNIH